MEEAEWLPSAKRDKETDDLSPQTRCQMILENSCELRYDNGMIVTVRQCLHFVIS